jgi:anti-sigma regulatory factor (Ser/Thr protein kinase)
MVRKLPCWTVNNMGTNWECSHIKTAVSEACLNAIEHGNKGNTEVKVHNYGL